MNFLLAQKRFSSGSSHHENMLAWWLSGVSAGRLLTSLVIVLSMLATACDRRPPATHDSPGSGEKRTFTGKLTAAGTRQIMQLEQGHEVSVFRLAGSLLLAGEQRLKKGFHSDFIGLSDNRSGLIGRSVWTDENGDQVFSDLKGGPDIVGTAITGTFIGGTGRFAGVTGEYTFKWQRLTSSEDGQISGRVVDFQGWARLTAPPKAQDEKGAQQ